MQHETVPAAKSAHDHRAHELLANVHPPSWQNPRPAGRYHLVVVGAGPAGLVAAHAAAGLGAKVALIERNRLGGDCLNTGCVPSKTLIRTSRLYAEMRDAETYGGQVPGKIEIDFAAVMERMRRVRARISRVDSAERLRAAGVDVYFGDASFAGPDAVTVGEATLRFRKAMIATGSRPETQSIPGLADAGFLTNETVFDLTVLPRRLLVIGGGPLGCELAQAFCRLGAEVSIVQDAPLFLPKEERDAVQLLSDAFARDGVHIYLNTAVTGVRRDGAMRFADLVSADYRSTLAVDQILTGIGRVPNIEGLGLKAAGVKADAVTGIAVNDFLQTTNPRIYAAGDVCLDSRFTHTADASARIVVQNALFLSRRRWSALTIPWCTYTDPEVAHVGLYVREAREKNIPIKTFTVPMHEVDRAIADGEEHGFVKIHVKEGTDTILGATVVARHAGEMINEISLAIVAGIGLSGIARVIHTYPTQAAAIRMAADAYNLTRLTPAIKWLAKRWLWW